ncbi:MAG: amidohydrolase [Rhodothermales bacterium]|jgi:amidohydrolase
MRSLLFLILAGFLLTPASAQIPADDLPGLVAGVSDEVLAWRRDIHANPELGNQEFRTAGIVASHLESLGMEIHTGIAYTGVLGILRGGKPGKTVALRADMDALPVTEQTGLAFASTVTTQYNGREVGVMHACGHDTHVAILMGVAEILASRQADLEGTVMFIFQPAEEGGGGARLMLEEGLFEIMKPDAVLGLHVGPGQEAGQIGFVTRGAMAASDGLRITVKGVQTHGAYPWRGVDPIVVASQIVLGLQTIPSRQTDATKAPAIVTIGQIQGGVRGNIIPAEVTMIGTIRTLDPDMQDDIHARIERTATLIAESAGATAEVQINRGYPVTFNDPELTRSSVAALRAALGASNVVEGVPAMGAEDFSYFANEVPGFYFWLGGRTPGVSIDGVATNHSPFFTVDEAALDVGVRAMTTAALSFLAND